MPVPVHVAGLTPSILDRLTDPESAGTAIMSGYSADKMFAAVMRDLEDLLNTRRTAGVIPAHLDEVQSSIVGYGLPDLSSADASSTNAREDVAAAIRAVIERFEPRLQDIGVFLLNPEDDPVRQAVKFRVDARLAVDPFPDIAFDTILEMGSGQYKVTEATGDSRA